MSEEIEIAELTVEEVLMRWPQTAVVFTRHNMACVGCPVAPFYSVSEAANVYRLPAAEFVQELEQEIAANTA